MIIVMRPQKFDMEQTGNYRCPLPIKIDAGKMIYYLPVYETIEDAKLEFPDGPFTEARLVSPVEGEG